MSKSIARFISGLVLIFSLLLADGSAVAEPGSSVAAATSESIEENAQAPDDAIARVGDQYITFSEINIAINSAAVVGVSIPTFGTQERDFVRLTMLDRLISANLIYLDALAQGIDQDTEYRKIMQEFSDAMLAAAYRKQFLSEKVSVSDEEVETYYNSSMAKEGELDDDMRTAIRSILYDAKMKQRKLDMSRELREKHRITINDAALEPEDEQERNDSAIVATIDEDEITWGDVKSLFLKPVSTGDIDRRRAMVNNMINYQFIVREAKAAGLDKDPQYLRRMGEFRKTRLITYHRQKLLEGMQPTDADITAYYEKYGERIAIPEARKVQMVVVKTREEAQQIKQQIESGELPMAKAAAEYSIVPDADKNLGEIGWVNKGSGFSALDELTFSLGPGEIGGPVESPAGWHVVTVLDQREGAHQSLDSPGTRDKIRKGMLEERLDLYTVDLRKNKFEVEVYNDVINELAQAEAKWFRELTEKSGSSEEKLKEQIEKLQRQ